MNAIVTLRWFRWTRAILLACVWAAGVLLTAGPATAQEAKEKSSALEEPTKRTKEDTSQTPSERGAKAPATQPAKPGQQQPAKPRSAMEEKAQEAVLERSRRHEPVPGDQLGDLLEGLDPSVLNLVGVEINVEAVGNDIIITGPKDKVEALEKLITMLDESVKGKVLEVVTVQNKNANEIAPSVEAAINDATATANRRPEDEVSVTALSSNILLVAALEKDIDFVVEVILQVDEVKDELGKIEQLVFQIKHRKASEVAEELIEIITKIREKAGARGAEGELQIIPNNANNTIMVLAPESEREKIQKLIDSIDVEAVKGWGELKLTLFPLLHSQARDLADVINDLMESPEGREQAKEAIIQRLIISKASPTTGEITDLPPIDLQRQLRIIPDEGTNSLIVATIEENVVPMGELIRLLDGVPMATDVGVRVFPLKHANAEEVRDILNGIFDDGKKLTEDPDGSGADGVPESEIGKSLVHNIGLSADVRTNTLIVSGRPEQLTFVETIVNQLDSAVDEKVLRVVTVTQKDAGEIASSVGEAVRDALQRPTTQPEEEVSVTALSDNILLVAALPEDIDFVVELIDKVDQVKSELGGVELFGLQVKHRKAFNVAEELREIITQLRERRGLSGEGELQFWPNNANNVITVIAPQSERQMVEQLLTQIDVEPVESYGAVKLTIFPLLHSQANQLSEVINNLLLSEEAQEATEEVIYRLAISKASPSGEITELPPIDLEKPMRIIPDEGTNSLIIATVEENMGPIGDLIRLLDDVPMGEEIGIKLFPLRFADAESVGDILEEMFDKGKQLPEDPDGSGADAVPEGTLGRAIAYNVGISADVRTNTLIVSGRQEQLFLVDMIVSELDRPATALKFPLRMFQLEHADATRIAQIVTELFDQRFEAAQATGANQAALERERVFLSVDIRSNALIISAADENYVEIVKIARQLDTKPAKLFDQIRIIECTRLSAMDIKEKIEELWQRKADLRQQEDLLADLPVIAVDERSNSLIIASSMEDFEEIEQLVEALESKPLIDDTRFFRLAYTDATVLAEMLDELFDGMKSIRESFEPPTVIPDQRTNSLMVAASRDTMERVEDVILRLDVEAGPNTAIFKIYPLTYGSAARLAPKMDELFDSRREGQDTLGTPIVILPDETSNSLVTSASRDDHDVITELLTMLDKPSSIARQVEIFPLKLARADSVAERLESLFSVEGQGGAGRADAIAAEADERTNSIIVWASPSEMENVAEIITRLDTATPAREMRIKVIQLRHALADDFAALLKETLIGEGGGGDEDEAIIVSFMQKLPNGRETIRKLLRQDIRIEPDARTNSLMVMAPDDSMAMLEAMIGEFDQIRPIRSELRLFPLINSDSEAMVEQLMDLFEPEAAGDGEATTQLWFGGDEFDGLEYPNIGQELRFAADTRTNTLIVAGAEIDLRMIEELVRYLDSQEAEDRVVEVYQASYRPAQDLASAVQGFIDQELGVLGELDDEEAQTRRMERQVSIESLGSEEEGSSRLIVGTSRHGYQRTMEMIQALDRPEPQVMLSVLIAEVKRTDNVELGVEIAGQDLTFSEEAVVGPNGIIQGSNFDWVAGTALGALTGSGFNFTLTGEDLSFVLHAMQQNSRLEVLSSPILMVRNGEEGKLTIADNVPFVTGSSLTTGGVQQSTIGREDVGIVLTATPHISPDGYVTIELVQEISNFSGENLEISPGVRSPIFSERKVETNVTVRDGETVIIGGLIQTRDSMSETKVPILGDLPVLGPLFRSTGVSKETTELMVVLTVDVLRTDEDVSRIAVEQRDHYELSPEVRQSPLMRGLRILPEEGGLGPVDEQQGTTPDTEPAPPAEERKLYGPKPKIYGPVISHPTTTTAIERPMYGPRIVRNETSETG